MTGFRLLSCTCLAVVAVYGSTGPRAAETAEALKGISLDPAQTYRVRDLQLTRGDVKIYLTDGILAFAQPVAGQPLAAIFTTDTVEAGDGEIIALPPTSSERASLASYTKAPNLNEHFTSAAFFFSDKTQQ